MVKPTQAAPKELNFEKLSDKEQRQVEKALLDLYQTEYGNLDSFLFIQRYLGNNYKINNDVLKLLEYDNLFLIGFKSYINNSSDKKEHDIEIAYYKDDILNKIDLVLYLRKSNISTPLDSLTEYIRPNYLEDIFNIIKAYIKATASNNWVDRDEAIKFINKLNSDLVITLKAYIELKLQTLYKKYGVSFVNSDYVRNHFEQEDRYTYNYITSALNLIENSKKGKPRFRLPFNK